MTELWRFIVEKAKTDPAYYRVLREYETGRYTQDAVILPLLKFLTEQRDSLFKAVLDYRLTHVEPILSMPSEKDAAK